MTIEALLKAVPPPSEPFEAYDGPWEQIEAELGTPLPQDYKDFARLYGYGYFMEFMGICIPRTKNRNTRLEAFARDLARSFKDDEGFPYMMWPHRQGVLPFGSTDNGDYLFWLRVGPPESWRVVVWGRHEPFDAPCEMLDCDLTGFLAGLATGEIRPNAFPDDFYPFEPLFQLSAPLKPKASATALARPARSPRCLGSR